MVKGIVREVEIEEESRKILLVSGAGDGGKGKKYEVHRAL